jgi:ribonuclease HII
LACSSRYERAAWAKGFLRVAGLDEAGRGCLFGPVCAAAVILDPERPIRGLNDSKQLAPERRTVLAGRIRERARAWAVEFVDARTIDQINILQASRLAMKRALERLSPFPDYLLVDAVRVDSAIEQLPLIHGDARSFSIAAASILAKVDRDAALIEFERDYPGYGLASNKGYSTPDHLRALAGLGPTPLHRFSYAPVRAAAGLDPEQLRLFQEQAP